MYFRTGIKEIDAIKLRPMDGHARTVTKTVRIADGPTGYVFSLGKEGVIYTPFGVERHASLYSLPQRPWVKPIIVAAKRFGLVSKASFDAFVRLYDEERVKQDRESDIDSLRRIAKRAKIGTKALAPLEAKIRRSKSYRREP